MLHRFLETIQGGEMQSLLEIARTLELSPEMVLQITNELTNRGYLQAAGADCDEPKMGCSDCAANRGCQVIARHWFLTEKGRTAVSNKLMAKL
jgi:DNA-binding Lrp family transcriptional regulator